MDNPMLIPPGAIGALLLLRWAWLGFTAWRARKDIEYISKHSRGNRVEIPRWWREPTRQPRRLLDDVLLDLWQRWRHRRGRARRKDA
jgi:hypothetical protein